MKTLFMGTIAASLALVIAAPVEATRTTEKYTSLTVFGDSLVDAGNIFTLTFGAIPDPAQGYFQGRFTNGFDYTDLLSIDLFGTETVASLQGGTNFAFGGARATTTSGVPDLNEQLEQYNGFLSIPGNDVDSNGLFVLNFGGNDVFNAPDDPGDADAFIRQAAQNYAASVQTLNNLGARNVLITGFPVFGDPLSNLGEDYLTEELALLNLSDDTTLFRFSYLDFFETVLTDPGSLGLPPQDILTTCLAEGGPATTNNCEGIFSFDGVHFTAQVHEALFRDLDRQFNLTAAIPEPATWAMMIFGFFLTGSAIRRRRVTMQVSYS